MSIERPSRRTVVGLGAVGLLSAAVGIASRVGTDPTPRPSGQSVALPRPETESDTSLEAAIANRRSRREYGDQSLERDDLGQLLWSAQGITDRASGHRAAPSAGALYPLELYVVVGDPGVEGLDSGVYRYRPASHDLAQIGTENVQPELRRAALDQEGVADAAIDIVVCAVDERTTRKYGKRGERRYVPMEAGHVGENVYLQAESRSLATVTIGAFGDERVRNLVGAPADQRPLYVIPVGTRPA
jgi:SagB-type dehydrogenase family enzyme